MSDIKSRTDAYLAYALGETDTYPAPQTRLDETLIELAETIRLGGASPSEIKQAINDYLAANPPQVKMTDEEIVKSIKRSIASGDLELDGSLTDEQKEKIDKIDDLEDAIDDSEIKTIEITDDVFKLTVNGGDEYEAAIKLKAIGELSDLKTEAKDNIVGALNELNGKISGIKDLGAIDLLEYALTLTSPISEFMVKACVNSPEDAGAGYCKVMVNDLESTTVIIFESSVTGDVWVTVYKEGLWTTWKKIGNGGSTDVEEIIKEFVNPNDVTLETTSTNVYEAINEAFAATKDQMMVFENKRVQIEVEDLPVNAKTILICKNCTELPDEHTDGICVLRYHKDETLGEDGTFLQLQFISEYGQIWYADLQKGQWSPWRKMLSTFDILRTLNENANDTEVLGARALYEKLNEYILKTAITDTIDDASTDEEIPSAKAVYEKINEYIPKTAVTDTVDEESTEEEIPSAKAVYDAIKDNQNVKIQTIESIKVANVETDSTYEVVDMVYHVFNNTYYLWSKNTSSSTANVYSSPDGKTWTKVKSATNLPHYYITRAYSCNNELFVRSGNKSGTGYLYRCTDLNKLSFTKVMSSGVTAYPNMLYTSHGNFVYGPYYSMDGDTWTAATIDGSGTVYWVAEFKGWLYAGYTNGYVLASDNGGQTWTEDVTLSDTSIFIDAAQNDDMLIAVSSSGSIIINSDGANWVERGKLDIKDDIPQNYSLNVVGIEYINGLFVITTRTGDVIYSSDGINWTRTHHYVANQFNHCAALPTMNQVHMFGSSGLHYIANVPPPDDESGKSLSNVIGDVRGEINKNKYELKVYSKTYSGTTDTSGNLVTTMAPSGITIIGAYRTDAASMVATYVTADGKWAFRVLTTTTSVAIVKSTAVKITYLYHEV